MVGVSEALVHQGVGGSGIGDGNVARCASLPLSGESARVQAAKSALLRRARADIGVQSHFVAHHYSGKQNPLIWVA